MNKQELVQELRAIGIQEGDTLEVHSSLSSFGHIEGGADTVIEALIECVGETGSIFMPALRLSRELELTDEDKAMGLTTKIRILPGNAKSTAMGVIADTFRQRSDVTTGDGIFRIAGWGLHGKEAITGGLDYVIHHGGKALMLGVDIYKLTAMHYMEDIMPQEINDIFAPNDEICNKYPSDQWFIETGKPPVQAWYTIQEMAYEKGMIQDGYIGSCKYMYFNVWDVISLYRKELETDPYQLYGVPKRS